MIVNRRPTANLLDRFRKRRMAYDDGFRLVCKTGVGEILHENLREILRKPLHSVLEQQLNWTTHKGFTEWVYNDRST